MVRCARESVLSSDCGWVDYVQSPMPSDWKSIGYVYDPSGRRIEKKYDGQAVMKYLYDGDSIIAEYDATGALVHKYIYGPGVDQPICMIDVADANATYYYHFDGLGSVIALTDSSGAVANLYEYSIFGEVSASDPNHPNRFLFTGREFDSETGLYYYRARYYNPYIGRFLQTDPIGYGDGMNWYAYCGNAPVNMADPSGLVRISFYDGSDSSTGFAANGNIWKNMADDEWFDFSFDMRNGEFTPYDTVADYIIAKLTDLQNKGYKITEVYFFDHGWDGTELDPNNQPTKVAGGGFSLGDEWYTIDERKPADAPMGNGSMEKFAKRLGTLLNADAYSLNGDAPYTGPTIHLRSCYGGQFAEQFASWSGLQTTGWTKEVSYGAADDLPNDPMDWIPDYHGNGDYVTWTPIKGMGNGAKLTNRTSWYTGY